MFDNKEIYNRYESCHDASSSGELARILGIARQTTNDWKNGVSRVPWWRLKELVDTQGVSWDWLLVGKGGKLHAGEPHGALRGFDIKGINDRFFSLFPIGLSQAELGRRIGVSPVTIHKWQQYQKQVSWRRLGKAIKENKATWNWIIEG